MCKRSAIHFTGSTVSARSADGRRHLAGIPVGQPGQIRLPPAQPLEFLRHDAFGPGHGGLRPFGAVMFRPHPCRHAQSLVNFSQ